MSNPRVPTQSTESQLHLLDHGDDDEAPRLPSQVLLYVADPEVRGRMAALDAAANGADPLRYAFIVSQVGCANTWKQGNHLVAVDGRIR